VTNFFGRPFVKRFALWYRTVVLSVCPVCDVGALWPNGWTDQDETWHAGRPRPRPHCVLHEYPAPPHKKGTSPSQFSARVLLPNGWIDQDVIWYGGRPRPRRHCVRWRPSSPPEKGHAPNFWPMSILAKRSPISAAAELVLNFRVLIIYLEWMKLGISNLVCTLILMSTSPGRIDYSKRMCSWSRDLFKFWELIDSISATVQDSNIVRPTMGG